MPRDAIEVSPCSFKQAANGHTFPEKKERLDLFAVISCWQGMRPIFRVIYFFCSQIIDQRQEIG